jgi:hypothetical protein
MSLWYWLGVGLGLGVALGIAIGALLAPLHGAVVLSAVMAGACGYLFAFVFFLGSLTALVGAASGIVSGGAAAELARRTLRRGGTSGSTTFLLLIAAALAAGLAFVPGVGYAEAVLAAALALMMSRGGGDRYAGLRTLARD